MMTSANLDSEDIPQHDFNTYLQNCASQFKKLHKFKTNSTIEIRIYHELVGTIQSCETRIVLDADDEEDNDDVDNNAKCRSST